jgi:UDPglucose 6-dehydrogenase
MRITIIGTGYVGLVTGTCLASFGLSVTCVDNDNKKIKLLNNSKVPIYEPNLEDLIQKNVKENRLNFTTDMKKAIQESEVIFIAVGTPPNGDGSANLMHVEEVAKDIAKYINGYKVIVNKCTVPVGTACKIKKIITDYLQLSHPSSSSSPFDLISNPEFLREGSAIHDFTHPDKIVIGYESEKAKKIMQEIYRPLYLLDTPFVFTNPETAEMIKYACNAFLATKITFINEIANLCDMVGADIHQIAKAMGMDGRISPKFLHPGPGFGGSCFPKDTRALHAIANNENYDFKLIKAVVEANNRQREIVVDKIEKAMRNLNNKRIGILGLAFKQNTDDIRESAALDIIQMLVRKGATIKCFDPMAMENAQKILPDITYCQDEYSTASNADALVILTEWDQFRNLDFSKLKSIMKRHEYGLYFQPFIFDMKNLYEPEKVKSFDFKYYGIGRN